MRDSVRSILWKLYYSISANLVNFLVSLLISFIIPKFLGLEQYGYWQLYIFYVGYVGFFHFGHADGIYLRYGGKHYHELDKSVLHSQFLMLVGIEFFVSLSFILFALFRLVEVNRAIVLFATGLNCLLILPRTLLQFVLQGTGRVREYARNFILEKILSIIFITILLVNGLWKFEYMIIADILSKFIALIELGLICKDIIIVKGVSIRETFHEFFLNIAAGINLLLANIASLLIIGIVRFGIEKGWDITTFGQISFSLSISNFVITFIYAIGIVIFPIIKRSNQNKLPIIYDTLGTILSGIMIFFLIAYYPMQRLLLLWLPDYYVAIKYFAILFPISMFEARSSLLVNTYLKALREEKAMVILSGLVVLFSLFSTVVVIFWLKNLTLTLFSIVLLVIIKCYLPDVYLQRKMKLNLTRDMLWNISAAIAFIYCNWIIGEIRGWLIFIMMFVFMLIVRRKVFNKKIMEFKNLIAAT